MALTIYGDSPLGPWKSGGVLVDSRAPVLNQAAEFSPTPHSKLMYDTSLLVFQSEIPDQVYKEPEYGLNLYPLVEDIHLCPQLPLSRSWVQLPHRP